MDGLRCGFARRRAAAAAPVAEAALGVVETVLGGFRARSESDVEGVLDEGDESDSLRGFFAVLVRTFSSSSEEGSVSELRCCSACVSRLTGTP